MSVHTDAGPFCELCMEPAYSCECLPCPGCGEHGRSLVDSQTPLGLCWRCSCGFDEASCYECNKPPVWRIENKQTLGFGGQAAVACAEHLPLGWERVIHFT